MKNISKKRYLAFTLAEVLITLAIIGLVAALTIPTVITNYQKKMYVTQLKKSYNNINNAFRGYMGTQGVTQLTDTQLIASIPVNEGSDDGYAGSSEINDSEFSEFQNEINNIFKITKKYGPGEVPNYRIKYLNGSDAEDQEDMNGVILADGTLLSYWFRKKPEMAYCENNKPCSSLSQYQRHREQALANRNIGKANLWSIVGDVSIDVNGQKGPNTIGRDIFYFIVGNDGNIYPDEGHDIYVLNHGSGGRYWLYNHSCDPQSNNDGRGCAARIIEEGWEMKY